MAKRADPKDKVLRLLEGNPAMMPLDVVASSGLAPRVAMRALHALALDNLVQEHPGGSYEITCAGAKEVDGHHDDN